MRKLLNFHAKRNWINDPNGLCYFNGEYHLFYQFYPYEKKWGTMHWGHATTKDFLNWQDHPIALYPSIKADKNGCFSGSALVVDNQLEFYYTGVDYLIENPTDISVPLADTFIATQLKITSPDGYKFDNISGKKNIIAPIEDQKVGHIMHTRDPKVWIKDGVKYLILATKRPLDRDFEGGVLLYKEVDDEFILIDKYFDASLGNMWECPDYFEIEDMGFLIISPEKMTLNGQDYTNNAVISQATFNYETEKFSKEDSYCYLDYGLDFYAPQTFLDENNNRVMLGWLRMGDAFNEDYIGLMTMPRIISLIDGKLNYNVHPLLEQQFTVSSTIKDCGKIETTIGNGDLLNIYGIEISYNNEILTIDRSNVHPKLTGISNIKHLDVNTSEVILEIYLSQHVAEIFINHGKMVCTMVVGEKKDYLKLVNNYTIKEIHE